MTSKVRDIKMLIRLIETVIMTLFSQILRSEFAVFCHNYVKPKDFFVAKKVWLVYHFTSTNIPIWHSMCYLVSTSLYILVPFSLIGKKCEICIAQ